MKAVFAPNRVQVFIHNLWVNGRFPGMTYEQVLETMYYIPEGNYIKKGKHVWMVPELIIQDGEVVNE